MRSEKVAVWPYIQYLRVSRRITGSAEEQPSNVPGEWVKFDKLKGWRGALAFPMFCSFLTFKYCL